MTFDFTDNPSPVTNREDSPSPTVGRAVLPPSFRKIKELYNEDFEKQRWENEGGTDADRVDSPTRQYGVVDDNPIIQMVDEAIEQMDEQADYEAAVKTVSLAMEHADECRNQVKALVRYAIDRLSTLGGPADPPHPGALALVKRRKNLAL